MGRARERDSRRAWSLIGPGVLHIVVIVGAPIFAAESAFGSDCQCRGVIEEQISLLLYRGSS